MSQSPEPRRQSRSERTSQRLLAATETILRESDFAGASLASIARRADVTTGAIYSSFSGKADLLDALETQTYSAVKDEALAAFETAPRDLKDFAQAVVRAVVEVYSARRGSLRALAIAARNDEALGARSAELNRGIVASFVAAVSSRCSDDSPGFRRAAEIGFLVVTSALRDRIVFQVTWPLSVPTTDEDLISELASMLHSHLAAAGGECP